MRFLVMVFLSLFLTTNVSVAKPINCPDLKKKIADSYEMAGAIPLLARDLSGKNKHKKNTNWKEALTAY